MAPFQSILCSCTWTATTLCLRASDDVRLRNKDATICGSCGVHINFCNVCHHHLHYTVYEQWSPLTEFKYLDLYDCASCSLVFYRYIALANNYCWKLVNFNFKWFLDCMLSINDIVCCGTFTHDTADHQWVNLIILHVTHWMYLNWTWKIFVIEYIAAIVQASSPWHYASLLWLCRLCYVEKFRVISFNFPLNWIQLVVIYCSFRNGEIVHSTLRWKFVLRPQPGGINSPHTMWLIMLQKFVVDQLLRNSTALSSILNLALDNKTPLKYQRRGHQRTYRQWVHVAKLYLNFVQNKAVMACR